MLEVICWKWKSPPGYRSVFCGKNVNILRNMVRRFLNVEHRFNCITDNPKGIDSGIRIIPLWDEFSNIQNPSMKNGPSCYRRLKVFSSEAKEIIGERILSIDLDCVIVGDITPLVEREDDFICWGDTAKNTHYNGGLYLLKAGTRAQVYDTFNPKESPKITREKRIVGSDQAWISYCLNGKDPKWTTIDGVYSFRNHLQATGMKSLPENARIILFHGHLDPWSPFVQIKYPWVKEFYR